ncbi:MAG: hypothetical protein ABR589_09020 [Chthoniobacterales bacterium]
MRRLALCVFWALVFAAVADARKPKCTLRVHLEANARDGNAFSSPLRSSVTGKKIAIQKTPVIAEQDVVAFAPYSAADGTYGVLFQLNDHGRLALDTLSVERRGTFLYVFVNGRPAAELEIDRRVSDGKLYVASSLTRADIELMKKDWPLIGQRKK